MKTHRRNGNVHIGFSLACILLGILGLLLSKSYAPPSQASAEVAALDLTPTVSEEQGVKNSGEGTLNVYVPPPENYEVITVSADGDISDLLIPPEEYEDVDAGEFDFTLSKNSPIIIYHTHTTEAYRMTDDYTYEESSEWRTEDNSKNIVEVGEYLKTLLEEHGYTVIHDTTDHEPPKLSTSYERSVITMEQYKEKYPDARLFIDLHRDAAGSALVDDYVTVDGKETARLMFVVGRGDDYSQKPYYESNLAFANLLTQSLEGMAEGLTREIRVKSGRYNQHISDMCILVEAGHNQNTLQQALNLMDVFADVLVQNIS